MATASTYLLEATTTLDFTELVTIHDQLYCRVMVLAVLIMAKLNTEQS